MASSVNSIHLFAFNTARPNVSVVHYGSLDEGFAGALEDHKYIKLIAATSGGKSPDDLHRDKELEHILLLSISSISDVPEVVIGCQRLLKYARLDWLRLPDACYLQGLLPPEVSRILHQNFVRLSVDPNKFDGALQVHEVFEPLGIGENILLNRRLVTLLYPPDARLKLKPILDEVMDGYNLKPAGVLHVGANYGQEIDYYRDKKYSPVILIEANPDLAGHLAQLTANDHDFYSVNVAATDKDGPVTLNITGNAQGSSLLPPTSEGIAEFGEAFHVERTVTVDGRRLDGLVIDLKIPPGAFSLLHLDIQGAEGMALRGAGGLLKHVQVVLSELNFMEHYEGCAQIEEIDDLLEAAGFVRVAIDCTYSASWGDGIYIRKSLLPV